MINYFFRALIPGGAVTELRNRHTKNDINAGINIRKVDFQLKIF